MTRQNLQSSTGVIFASFAGEAAAMQLASECATANHAGYSLTICADNQSLFKAIEYRSLLNHHLGPLIYHQR